MNGRRDTADVLMAAAVLVLSVALAGVCVVIALWGVGVLG